METTLAVDAVLLEDVQVVKQLCLVCVVHLAAGFYFTYVILIVEVDLDKILDHYFFAFFVVVGLFVENLAFEHSVAFVFEGYLVSV